MPNASPTITARPTVYRGVQMRSRLEASYAQWLDRVGAVWQYEPQCFANERRQYLPDFGTTVRFLGHDRQAYIEVKPTWGLTPSRRDLFEMGAAIWATDETALFIVEIADFDHPLVLLPPSYGVTDPLDCCWIQEAERRMPTLGFQADQEWRGRY